jgi:uncharacterized membrane protein
MDDDREQRRYERTHDPARVLALSDGVCAIIITLLVLEVHVPERIHRGESLLSELRSLRPSIVAFLISFVVVAIAWVGHRDLFALIRRTDRTLVWLNILYLLPLCLLPFGASLIARYPKDAVALRMYGLLLVAVAATRVWIWLYATGHVHLLYDPIDRQFRRAGVAVAVGPAVAYLVAFALADVAPTASMIIYGAVPIVYFIGITVARSTAPSGSAEGDLT